MVGVGAVLDACAAVDAEPEDDASRLVVRA
jgi:hypothetical protein